jgi:hypothetical protein
MKIFRAEQDSHLKNPYEKRQVLKKYLHKEVRSKDGYVIFDSQEKSTDKEKE